MKYFHVFNAQKKFGITCTVPTSALATLIAFCLTAVTGDCHLFWEIRQGALTNG